jgi:hypothetical protein
MVTVTPRIAKERIIIEAKIERTSIHEEETAVIAKADNGEETHASAMVTGSAQTTIAVEPGKTVIVGGITRQGKDAGDGEVILISAEVTGRGSSPAPDRSGEGGSLHRRYAEGLVKQFDENNNGVLDRDEWKKMRGDPAKADGNDDEIVTVDAAPAARKWEYKSLPINRDEQQLERLAEAGEEGWEAYAVTVTHNAPAQNHNVKVYLKRSKR